MAGRRSALVWYLRPDDAERHAAMDDATLAVAIERQAHSMLGKMRIAGPRAVIPITGLTVDSYVAPRLALVGEAAHVFPSIGAQGLNLGFRDVAALRDAVLDARDDVGGDDALSAYQRGRGLDVRLRSTAVHGLNTSLLTSFLPVDFLRGVGLLALGSIAPLRRAVMREGVVPSMGTPSLMRDDPVGASESVRRRDTEP
jgi:2-octaprenyl-6-methoxyphenol hydroxylase